MHIPVTSLPLTRHPLLSPRSSSCSCPLIRSFLSPLAVVILIACLGIGFGFDIVTWFLEGIRSIELDDESLTLTRARPWQMLRIERRTVTAVSFRSRLWRRGAVILLADRRALRIPEDAFPRSSSSAFSPPWQTGLTPAAQARRR